jgi:hypothetical protein
MDDQFSAAAVRPYFVPASVDYAALPEPVQLAFSAIIQPTYDELVLGAASALARSAGVSLCFLLAIEVLDQFEIGEQLSFLGISHDADRDQRDRTIARHLRLVGAKQHAASFLLRLETLRDRQDPVQWSFPEAPR